jgi:hypothetical protein
MTREQRFYLGLENPVNTRGELTAGMGEKLMLIPPDSIFAPEPNRA